MVPRILPLHLVRVQSKSRLPSIQAILSISSQPKENKDELVLTEVINNKGVLTLNRPEALNSLNYPMSKKILQTLNEWESKLQCVIVKGSGGKAFCAGGDIISITSGTPLSCQHGKDFFRIEYTKDYKVGQYKIPYISLIDGITMGGGVGLSVHGKYRVATEKTLFAMPETAIGLFPDVGASHFLPKLEGKLGMYLALTGQRLRGKDVVKLGLGTHYIESKDVPKLYDAILNSSGDVGNVIKEHSHDIASHTCTLSPYIDIINDSFSAPTVEEILLRLKKEGSRFSCETINLLNKMSPTSLKICKLELEKGANMSLKECLKMEYGLAKAALEATASPDFYEGVRALLKDKDQNPKWKPATLEEVDNDLVNKLFLPLSQEEELIL